MDYRKILATMSALEELMEEWKTIHTIHADKNHFIIMGQTGIKTKEPFELVLYIDPIKLYVLKGDPLILYSLVDFQQELNKTFYLIETDQI